MSTVQPLLQPLLGSHADSRDGFATRLTTAFWRQRPLIVLGALIVIAWTALVAMLWGEPSAAHLAASPWWCMVDMGSNTSQSGLAGSVFEGMPMWSLMAMAMMLPACAPILRRTAELSGGRPWRAVVTFTSIYLLVWLAFGVAALSLRAGLPATSRGALIVVLVIAAAWQLTSYKRRALKACRCVVVPAAPGRSVVVGSAVLGLGVGRACLVSCWAIMLTMAMVAADQLLWAVGLTLLVCSERLLGGPQRASRVAAAVLAVLAFELSLAVVV